MTGRRILVTGGAGYIGQHVCKLLQFMGDTPYLVENFSNSPNNTVYGKSLPGIGYNGNFDVASDTDIDSLSGLLASQRSYSGIEIDGIIHLAGRIDSAESMKFPMDYYRTNVVGTLNMLELAQRLDINKFVFASSAAVYSPYAGADPFREEDAMVSRNPYGWSKKIAERAILDYVDANPTMKATSLRMFNVGGASSETEIGESHRKETHLIPSIISAYLDKKPFTVYGDGLSVRDYVHVEDVAQAFVAAYNAFDNDTYGPVYNVCTGEGTNILDVVETLKGLGIAPEIQFKSRRADDDGDLIGTNDLIYRDLKWDPEHFLLEIVLSAIDWEFAKRPYNAEEYTKRDQHV